LTDRFLNYGRQFIDEKDIDVVLGVLRSDFLTQGPAVELFERSLCAYTGAKYAVAVSSGTAALHVSSLAAGMKPGDCGVTSTLTFVASANAFLYCGSDANVIDIDPYSLSLSTQGLEKAIAQKDNIKVIVPVHYGGLASDDITIKTLAGSRIVIEDASHSLGGKYNKGGSIGNGLNADMSVFSFHPVKPITTGEGGAIMTNNLDLYNRLKTFSNHGIERDTKRLSEPHQTNPWYYEQRVLGFNYRMSDIHAALGYAQLKKLDGFIRRRRKIAEIYDEAFAKNTAISLPQSKWDDRARSAHHLYIVEFDFPGIGLTRREFVDKLNSYNVGGQIHYIPVHHQPYHREKYNYQNINFPAAEHYYSRCLSLPMHAGLTDDEIGRVINSINVTINTCITG
jgi:UDP-4-amino-4,6-dideoxy-N-acetyl-beta-L-altrosamine transaminase